MIDLEKNKIMTVSVLAFILSLNLSTVWAACNDGDFDCNGESGLSAYCCYHIVSETNGLKDIEIYKDPAAGNNPAKVGESAFDSEYGRGQDIGTVVIKEGVTQLETYAFYGANNLTSVDMPNVERILGWAFNGASSLTSVDMPNVTELETQVFKEATSLTTVSMPNVETVSSWIFEGATSLSYVEFNPENSNLDIDSTAFMNSPLSSCSKDNYYGCTICPDRAFQPNTLGGGGNCVDICADGYTSNNGLCKPISTAQNAGSGGTTTAASCTNGASIGGECFPRRYTPAEIAELVGESNTILLYYK